MKIYKITTKRYEGLETSDGHFVLHRCKADLMAWKEVITCDSNGRPFVSNEYYDDGTLAWSKNPNIELIEPNVGIKTQRVERFYDDKSNLIKRIVYKADSNEVDHGDTFQYQYDKSGNKILREGFDLLTGNRNFVVEYSYDGYGNMITLREYTSYPNEPKSCYVVHRTIKYHKPKDENIAPFRHPRTAS
jgi:hypothetical protein